MTRWFCWADLSIQDRDTIRWRLFGFVWALVMIMGATFLVYQVILSLSEGWWN